MAEIRLKPLDERWISDLEELVADPEALRFTRIREPPPPGFARDWISSYADGRRNGTRDGFAAIDEHGKFVGVGLAPRIEQDAAEVELGYIVVPEARGRGVATEILRLLTSWALEDLQAQRIYLTIDVENPASSVVAARCGYRLEGVMRSIHVKQGRRGDAELWSRLPTDA
jgi:RimJ/RimL family protein N-acetyltransferase